MIDVKKIIVLLIMLICFGCSGVKSINNNESYVVDPKGNKYLVSLRKDAKVTFKHPDGSIFEVDNRGREGVIEGLIKMYGVSVINSAK